MQEQEVHDLLKKYLAGNCTAQERAILETWYLKHEHTGLPLLSAEKKARQLEEIWTALDNEIGISTHTPPPRSSWIRMLPAAAMLLISLGITFYFYNRPYKQQAAAIKQQNIVQIKPGSNKAVLTLADGRTITLDDAKNGAIATEDGVTITKTKNGQLVYDGKTNITALNHIATPKGGQYQISLPDGTKVWLNAESALSYPAAFTGSTREVTLRGEAYFEVAKDKTKPFMVHTQKQEIKVLGTHFNVNAYSDEEQTRTTLLEGSVKVKQADAATSALLKPGEQAVSGVGQLDISAVDVAEAIAWKEGYFLFQDEDIRSIMKKIARWYDVEVVYAPDVSQKKIGGHISRSKPLTAVLKTLTNTDKFNFKVEGRRVTVMP